MGSWEPVEDNLIKKQMGNKINQGFNLNEFPTLGGSNSKSEANLRAQLAQLQSGENGSGLTAAVPPPGLQQQLPTQSQSITNNDKPKTKQKSEDEIADMDKFALNGLLGLLRNENNDLNTMAIGTDLNILGLDMSDNSIDQKLSRTFPSPWIETSRSEVEPQYQVHDFLQMDDTPDIKDKLTLFSDETLFYIFYTRTRDVLQELSARVLTQRNWRYHKELQVWLTKDSNTEPVQQSPQSERGLYIFFDPHNWEKVRREFLLFYHSIMTSS